MIFHSKDQLEAARAARIKTIQDTQTKRADLKARSKTRGQRAHGARPVAKPVAPAAPVVPTRKARSR